MKNYDLFSSRSSLQASEKSSQAKLFKTPGSRAFFRAEPRLDPALHKVKLKNAPNEKRKKLCGFSFSINMANFEAFCWTKKLISNLFFLKSVVGISELPTDRQNI